MRGCCDWAGVAGCDAAGAGGAALGARGGARLEAETMGLADHGIAGDAAELVGDLARRHALAPQLL
jgi:hypothetical protein